MASPLQRIPRAIAAGLQGACLLLASGCQQRATITSADVDEVLTKAVAATGQKVPAGFCLAPALRPSVTIAVPPGDGWYSLKDAPGVAYRRLPAPATARLSARALAAFTGHAAAPCRHQIEFSMPNFLEAKKQGAITVAALIDMGDFCPTCGGGYSAQAVKEGGQWKIEPPGFALAWIS